MRRFQGFYSSLLAVTWVLYSTVAFADGVQDTKHNLSISGPGPIIAATEDRICIFCHTPHNTAPGMPYLWNRSSDVVQYTPYESTTLQATVGQPTGASRICLSCHDGTIALGAIGSEDKEIPFAGGLRMMPPGSSRLGTDLSDDHPVSFVYDQRLVAAHGELKDPSLLPPVVRLDGAQQMQCTACHDPHSDLHGKFLVMSNRYSALCTACHDLYRWNISSHSVSNAWWNGAGVDPWLQSEYQTVAENGCQNCHQPHSAEGSQRLLKYVYEEDNCLVCHKGNVARENIESELTKPFRHSVLDYTGVHDPAEDFVSGYVQRHVECEDCHNPHQANGDLSPDPPVVSGANVGVKGVDIAGNLLPESLKLYEICFKCHGDYPMTTTLAVTRQIPQLNTRLQFNPANPSYHPVAAPGRNQDVPSLIAPLSTSSLIACTDCHNNDDQLGPQGPHGSNFRYLLERNYTTADNTRESGRAYSLCYKCHSRASILSDVSFSEHSQHIVDEDAPCSACHDPHGISNTQGTSVNNSHLINFDLTIVRPSGGQIRYEDLGNRAGRCFLNCHGENHDPETYP